MFNEFRNGIYEIKCMILVLFRLLDVSDLTNTLNLSLSQNKKNIYIVSQSVHYTDRDGSDQTAEKRRMNSVFFCSHMI